MPRRGAQPVFDLISQHEFSPTALFIVLFFIALIVNVYRNSISFLIIIRPLQDGRQNLPALSEFTEVAEFHLHVRLNLSSNYPVTIPTAPFQRYPEDFFSPPDWGVLEKGVQVHERAREPFKPRPIESRIG